VGVRGGVADGRAEPLCVYAAHTCEKTEREKLLCFTSKKGINTVLSGRGPIKYLEKERDTQWAQG
jgi:hypothetical protein